MADEEIQATVNLEELLERADPASVEEFLDQLPPEETAYTLDRLDEEQRQELLALVSPEVAGELLEHLSDEHAADLLEILPAEVAAPIVAAMESDDQADLLGELSDEDVEAILQQMDPVAAQEVRELARYAPDTAGGLMITEYLSYPRDTPVEVTLQDLRENREQYVEYNVQYVYVTGEDEQLEGVVRLKDLVLAPGRKTLGQIMIPEPKFLVVDADLQAMESFFDRHAFYAAPVVDRQGRLVGVVRRAAVEELHGEQADAALLAISGIVGGEEFRSMPLAQRAMRRLQYLVPIIGLNFLAASVIAMYKDTLDRFVALAVFLPMVVGLCGAAGNQAVAVSIRELALGLVKPRDLVRVLVKEAGIGLLNGVILGTVVLAISAYWGRHADWEHWWYVALAVGGAIPLTMLLAVTVGGCLPLLLRIMRIDPAMASGPVLNTTVDMCGFYLVLTLATILLSRIAHVL